MDQPMATPQRNLTYRLVAYVGLTALAVLMGWGRFSSYAASRGRIQGHDPAELPGLERPEAGFVSSSTCRSCHPGHYATWHSSYHRTMTQVATPETVLAPFDDVRLELFGHEVRLGRSGDELWADMVDPELLEKYEELKSYVVNKDGPFPEKHKELFIAVAIAARNPSDADGIRNHLKRALQLGATVEEATEALECALAPCGMPVLIAGCTQLKEIVDEGY